MAGTITPAEMKLCASCNTKQLISATDVLCGMCKLGIETIAIGKSFDVNPKDQQASYKLCMHLVSPIVKAYQAIAHYLGNVKYGAWNYRMAGVTASIYRSAFDRHMDAWWEGEWYDPTDGTPHLANAQACINILIEAHHSGTLIDDRPPSRCEELAKIRAEFEVTIRRISEMYKDKSPRHYTIKDSKK